MQRLHNAPPAILSISVNRLRSGQCRKQFQTTGKGWRRHEANDERRQTHTGASSHSASQRALCPRLSYARCTGVRQSLYSQRLAIARLQRHHCGMPGHLRLLAGVLDMDLCCTERTIIELQNAAAIGHEIGAYVLRLADGQPVDADLYSAL